jgi:hypothetical protein
MEQLMPIALTDAQLKLVTEAAKPLPRDKRGALLQRIAGHLQQLGYRRVQDADDQHAISAALKGLLHAPAA